MSSMEPGRLLEFPELGLRILAGEEGLSRQIRNEDVNRPGLALAGFYRNFAHDRLQVFGQGEFAYLMDCGGEVENRIKEEFFNHQGFLTTSRGYNRNIQGFYTPVGRWFGKFSICWND